MTLMYVVGKNDFSGNETLKYSLRSVDKHASGVDDVIVVGYPPAWLKCKTLAVEDMSHGVYLGKHWNILNCIVQAVRHFGLKGEFMYSSDDHFLLKDTDFDKWPHWKCGELYTEEEYERRNGHPASSWQRSIVETRKLYDKVGATPLKSSCHANTRLNADYSEEVLELANDNKGMSNYGFEPTCLFTLASMLHGDKIEFETYNDGKCKTADDIHRWAGLGKVTMTLAHGAEVNRNVVNWMKKTYPQKSRWEK